MKKWKIILAALVLFAAGAVTGSLVLWKTGLAARYTPPRPPIGIDSPWIYQHPEFLRRMTRELDLTPEQLKRLGTVIDKSNQRTDPLWEMLRPPLKEELSRVRSEMRAELNPDQQAKFDELLKPGRYGRRPPDHNRHGGPPGRPPGSPGSFGPDKGKERWRPPKPPEGDLEAPRPAPPPSDPKPR